MRTIKIAGVALLLSTSSFALAQDATPDETEVQDERGAAVSAAARTAAQAETREGGVAGAVLLETSASQAGRDAVANAAAAAAQGRAQAEVARATAAAARENAAAARENASAAREQAQQARQTAQDARDNAREARGRRGPGS